MAGFNKDSKGYWIEKDPGAELDYSMDWTAWLQAGETIMSSTWTVSAGMTKVSESSGASTTTVWLSGGVAGREYMVTNEIVTSAGRRDDRSFRLSVEKR